MRIRIPFLIGLFGFILAGNTARAGDDLAKALRAVTNAKGYSFSAQDRAANSAVEAKFQKDVPLYCVADKIEFFRTAEVLVYKQKDAWQRTRTGTLSDPLLILGASAKVRAIRLPHEELAVLGKALANVKKMQEKGGRIVNGELPAASAKQLARTEDRDLARSATATLWLDGEGRLVKYEISIRVEGRRGNVDVDGVMTRTVTLSDVGSTKVDLPSGAKKALEEKRE